MGHKAAATIHRFEVTRPPFRRRNGLQLFVTDLMKAGLSKDQIMTMGREVTGKLLMG